MTRARVETLGGKQRVLDYMIDRAIKDDRLENCCECQNIISLREGSREGLALRFKKDLGDVGKPVCASCLPGFLHRQRRSMPGVFFDNLERVAQWIKIMDPPQESVYRESLERRLEYEIPGLSYVIHYMETGGPS